MPQANLGPVFRHMADVMKDTAKSLRKEIEKLRQKIRNRLPPKQRDRFDKDWNKAPDTKGQRAAAANMYGRVMRKILELGEIVDPEYAAARDELQALIDLLRALETIEDLEDHFDKMAKAFGS
jgi:hypothetical protein